MWSPLRKLILHVVAARHKGTMPGARGAACYKCRTVCYKCCAACYKCRTVC